MSWARYDDEFSSNWKVSTLAAQGVEGVAAIGLHVLANCWSRNQGLGGFVPDFKPGQLVGDARLGARLAARLEEVGMFDPTESGWLLHDFDEYSDPNDDGTPASEKKRKISEARRAAGSKGGKAKAAKQTASKPPSKTVANGQQTSTPDPDPVPSSYISTDTPPPRHGSPEVANPVDKRTAVLDAYAEMAFAKASNVSKPVPWKKSAKNTGRQHPDFERYITCYPDAPASAIAAWLHGEKQSMQYYAPIDPNAPDADVIALRQNTA